MMNKDVEVLSFTIDSTSGLEVISSVAMKRADLLPLSLRITKSLQHWLDSRLILSHRHDVRAMFRALGVNTLSDIILCTNCISLFDTYWVKSALHPKKKWNAVSPYRNPLNRTIAEFSFTGSRVNGKRITHSPDLSTGGNFPKCWKKVDGEIYLYKAGSSGALNSGQEPYSEVLASALADRMGMNHVRYQLAVYKKTLVTRCKNICTEEVGICSIAEAMGDVTYQELLERFPSKQLTDMLLLDYLTMNPDRHLNNISVLVRNDTQEILGIAPIYDNNLALLPYYMPSDGTIENYVDNDNGCICAADNSTFAELLELIKSPYVANQIRSLKGYRFPSAIPRAGIADEVLQRQVSRAEQQLKEWTM